MRSKEFSSMLKEGKQINQRLADERRIFWSMFHGATKETFRLTILGVIQFSKTFELEIHRLPPERIKAALDSLAAQGVVIKFSDETYTGIGSTSIEENWHIVDKWLSNR